jgi:hypothetical protein
MTFPRLAAFGAEGPISSLGMFNGGARSPLRHVIRCDPDGPRQRRFIRTQSSFVACKRVRAWSTKRQIVRTEDLIDVRRGPRLRRQLHEARVTADVSIGPRDGSGFGLAVKLHVKSASRKQNWARSPGKRMKKSVPIRTLLAEMSTSRSRLKGA